MKTLIDTLPPLPTTAHEIEAIYKDPESSFTEMVDIINKDAFITATILKSVNSPLYGFSRSISSVQQAVSLFGKDNIRAIVLSSAVLSLFKFDLTPYDINEVNFRDLTLKQNSLAIAWCKQDSPDLTGVLSASSFLIEIGKFLISQNILTNHKTINFKELIKSDNLLYTSSTLAKYEKKIVSYTTAEISSMLLDSWLLDSSIINIIKHADEPFEADMSNIKACSILNMIRNAVLLDGTMNSDSIAIARDVAIKYNLDLDLFDSIFIAD